MSNPAYFRGRGFWVIATVVILTITLIRVRYQGRVAGWSWHMGWTERWGLDTRRLVILDRPLGTNVFAGQFYQCGRIYFYAMRYVADD